MPNDKYIAAKEKMLGAGRVLLVTHERPDGDALSSICAVMEYLELNNVRYTAYCHDAPPDQFGFLPHVEKITSDKSAFDFYDHDLIIALDCGSLSRTGLAEEIAGRRKNQIIIEFDHHPKIDDYADIEMRIAGISSTAEVLYRFFKANKIKITKNLANCLLTGILTDTGNLLYTSTTKNTIEAASKMLSYGARFPIILENTWRNKSLASMQLWGRALNNLKINRKYGFAYSVLTYDDIRDSEATENELEGIPGFLSNLEGVKGLLFLREENPGKIKGSLRTARPDIDVSKLARALGGGGHPKASAFVLAGYIEKYNGGWKIK